MTIPEFDLNNFYHEDAEEIFSSRKKSIKIHKTTDIGAAGDEVEVAVREIIKARLPHYYYVSHGHIVDENLKNSGQFDVLIADNKISPLLFSAKNGTDYLTYESIYAVGEIKSTYRKSEFPIKKFVEKIKVVNDELSRTKTTPEYVTPDFKIIANEGLKIESSDKRAYKNPLFKFLFFVASGDFNLENLSNELSDYDDVCLPNLICFLDKGFIVNAEVFLKESYSPTIDEFDFSKGRDGLMNQIFGGELMKKAFENSHFETGAIELFPEFIMNSERKKFKWTLFKFDEKQTSASVLAFLIYTLNQHIGSCILQRPNLKQYHSKLFNPKSPDVLFEIGKK